MVDIVTMVLIITVILCLGAVMLGPLMLDFIRDIKHLRE